MGAKGEEQDIYICLLKSFIAYDIVNIASNQYKGKKGCLLFSAV